MIREFYGKVPFDYYEDENGETVEQVIVSDTKYIDIEYFAKVKADLEAKLAEYEEEIKQYENAMVLDYNTRKWRKIGDIQQENEQLKQQLAEKNEENLILFSMLYETLEKQGYENITSTIEQMTNLTLEKQSNWLKENCVKNQDKISFCVEQLEKVKDEIDNNAYYDYENECNVVESYKLWSFVDVLIEELKKEGK